MNYYFAPMEGVTNHTYRSVHKKYFSGIEKYYAPFVSPTQNREFTERDLKELRPENNAGLYLVPQLLVNSAENFRWAAHELAAMGYREINLNLGCPSGTVTAKRKGAGALGDLVALRALLDGIFDGAECDVSIKTRLGLRSYDEFGAILELYNAYPVSELVIHARVREDMYKKPASQEAFERYYRLSAAPVCYNGDLFSPEDCTAFSARFHSVSSAMLGRGIAANPALAEEADGGAPASRGRIKEFHAELYARYRESLWSDNAVLCHMKELWSYMEGLFPEKRTAVKKIKKASSLDNYSAAVNELFQ